ncbi:hypothetical protein P171DRAFT_428658 [Karstenula rhodostoma CBS 690.94]|uniref:Uncharacterized protein n=1 Tax=Karstenula rhodostoma CBS 690.94 TaxID=1392251 RepID=A0A9P4PNY5_9PLEO|nr:hypothetical protein P171DRAFT_428658 [Karstenula rhodostoma CBS 690.94]
MTIINDLHLEHASKGRSPGLDEKSHVTRKIARFLEHERKAESAYHKWVSSTKSHKKSSGTMFDSLRLGGKPVLCYGCHPRFTQRWRLPHKTR